MKLKEAIPMYQGYRQRLVDQTRALVKQRDAAQKKFEATGDKAWEEQAASLQLSVLESNEEFNKNQEVLDGLVEQHALAWNSEVNRALADPETGMAATLGKIMTTIARMCAGDKVPYSDEKKVMEYDDELYARVKQAQMTMAAMKKKQKEYDSLWDDEEGGEYDPEGVADNTEAAGDLPEIPPVEPAEGAETSADIEV